MQYIISVFQCFKVICITTNMMQTFDSKELATKNIKGRICWQTVFGEYSECLPEKKVVKSGAKSSNPLTNRLSENQSISQKVVFLTTFVRHNTTFVSLTTL